MIANLHQKGRKFEMDLDD